MFQAALGDHVGPAGQVWSTHSVITGHMYGIVFVAELQKDFTVTPSSVGISTVSTYARTVYNMQISFCVCFDHINGLCVRVEMGTEYT